MSVSKEEIKEMAKKVPMATDALEQAINTACVVLQGKKDGCTIRELREKAKVSAHDLTDAVAGLMLAGKATYTGDRSRTVIMVNKQLERFIIDSLQNNQNYTFDKVQKEAEGAGYSPDEFRDAVERLRVRGSVIIEAHGKIKLPFHPPPAKAVAFQLAPRGSEGERYYEEASPTTYQFKNEFVKDHERVLYSSAFRRLAGVTQVFGTSQGHVFHNRLTHSIKAGQIARSIADRLKPYARVDLQFDPDVVEAAALAHDLGHPPFGHTGELELDSLLTKNGVLDGYEGNAQNLRIVTQFSRVRREFGGLNLTRATLNALIKYPWLRESREQKKWNAYTTEKRFFEFARSEMKKGKEKDKSLEAKVMEWADDITYGVHDIEDGVRAGMIPLSELLSDAGERERFLEGSKDSWGKQKCFNDSKHEAELAFNILVHLAQRDLWRPYDGDTAQQAALRQLTTTLHHRYILAVNWAGEGDELHFRPDYEGELTILKCLMRFYVFCNPVLLPQQYGQRRVIRELFGYFFEAAQRDRNVLPSRVREWFDLDDSLKPEPRAARAAADTVAGMTELEALAMHRLVTGTAA